VDYLPAVFSNEIARSVVRINGCGTCTGTLLPPLSQAQCRCSRQRPRWWLSVMDLIVNFKLKCTFGFLLLMNEKKL